MGPITSTIIGMYINLSLKKMEMGKYPLECKHSVITNRNKTSKCCNQKTVVNMGKHHGLRAITLFMTGWITSVIWVKNHINLCKPW